MGKATQIIHWEFTDNIIDQDIFLPQIIVPDFPGLK